MAGPPDTGGFFEASGVEVQQVARWNGTAWEALNGGTRGGPPARARALTVYDAGSGPALYVGGHFTSVSAAETTANFSARWPRCVP